MKKSLHFIVPVILLFVLSTTSCQKQTDYLPQITSLQASLNNLQQRCDSLANALQTTTANLQTTNTNVANLGKSIDSIKTQVAVIVGQIATLNTQLTATNANVTAIDTQITALNTQLNNLLNQLNIIIAELNIPSSLSSGLLAYYPFSGNANDVSGNGYNGTVNGATLTTDRFGNANSAYFIGAVSGPYNTSSLIPNYIIIPNLNENNVLTYSVSGWFQKSTSSVNREGTIFCGDQPLNPPGGLRFCIGSANNAQWNAEFQSNSSNGITNLNYASGSVNYSDGVWHSFCVTFNAQPGTINSSDFQIYIDGALIQTQAESSGNLSNVIAPINNGTLPTILGNAQGPAAPYNDGFPGSIDDIRVYNRVLTQTEITYLATH